MQSSYFRNVRTWIRSPALQADRAQLSSNYVHLHFGFFFPLVVGPHLQCSGATPHSEVRNHSWKGLAAGLGPKLPRLWPVALAFSHSSPARAPLGVAPSGPNLRLQAGTQDFLRYPCLNPYSLCMSHHESTKSQTESPVPLPTGVFLSKFLFWGKGRKGGQRAASHLGYPEVQAQGKKDGHPEWVSLCSQETSPVR